MQIIQCTNTHNTTTRKRTIQYIVIHYTAGTSSKKGSARGVANYIATTNREASADFIVDDEEIVQYNPDLQNRYTWAVGGTKMGNTTVLSARLYGTVNNFNSISIEMCSNKVNKSSLLAIEDDWYFTEETINNAVELTRQLMKDYNIPVENVIMHCEVNGKICPNPFCLNDSRLEQWYAFKDRLVDKEIEIEIPFTKGDFYGMTDLQRELFVKNVLYIGLLDRQADENGLKYWKSQLTDTVSLNDILYRFMQLEEYRKQTVTVAYRRLLNREPDKTGLESWVAWLKGEKTADDLYLAIKRTDEYKKKH